MKLHRCLSLALLVLAAWPPGLAAAASPGPSLTLREATAEALRANPDLDALDRMGEAAARRPDTERFLMPPMLEAQAVEWPTDTLDPRRARLMVMLTQEFPGRGKRAARVEALERRAAVVANERTMRAREVASDVAIAYADLAFARRTLDVLDENVALVRQMADAAEARYAAGRMAQQDVLKAIVERSRLEEQRVMAGEQAGMAEARLNTLMGRPADAPIGPLDAERTERLLPSFADLPALAAAPHPEARGAALERDAAAGTLAVAEAERRPDFVVQGGYMLMPDMRDAWTARVGITWPNAPWARKTLDAMAREAEADIVAADARRRAVDSRLQLMAREAWVRADAAAARIRLLATSVLPQSTHTLDVARAAYQNDQADFLDVLDAQRVLLDARLEYWRAIADRDRAFAELERATDLDLDRLPPTASLPSSGVSVVSCVVPFDAACR